jgi:mRNA-degrading endonuclease RelE of RelBE toxin-antitoxin system
MKIIETSIFTKKLKLHLSDEEYRKFQNELIANPKKGNVIRGSGGLRKIRWSAHDKGKSGGIRVIYYYISRREIILLLLIYSKSEADNFTNEQLKILKSIVERELK